ncbi:MAG: hypothetical protein Kow0089_12860 [Desulfobulbaceae bacterium]
MGKGMSRAFLAAVFFLALAGCGVYLSGLDAPFYLDDQGNVINSEAVRLERLSCEGVRASLEESRLVRRPVANLSFALNHLVAGYEPAAFRGVNIAIHALSGILLYLFLILTFRAPALAGRLSCPEWIAFFASLFWLVHPVQTQAVTYIVQRMTSMAAMFYVAAMMCYAAGRMAADLKRRLLWFVASFLCGVLALGSKEIAVTLPFMILLYEWFFFQDLRRGFLLKAGAAATVVAVILLLAMMFHDPHLIDNVVLEGYADRDFTLPERLLTEARVVVYYLGLLLLPLPSRLSLEYDFAVSTSLLSPVTTLGSLALLLALFAAACLGARRFRLVSFAAFWFFGNLVLESTFLPLELVFEHRLYLPSMLFFLPPVLGVYRVVRNRRSAAVALIVLACIPGFWTVQRNHLWAEPESFLRHDLQRAPGNYRAHYNLGYYYLGSGRFAEAVQHLERAMEMEPRYSRGNIDLGFSYLMLGRLDEALQYYERAREAFPDDPKILYYLGVVHRRKGENDSASYWFSEVLRRSPDHSRAHENLADIRAAQGRFAVAAQHYLVVLRLTGEDNFPVLVNLGNCYANMKQYDKAISWYRKALELRPDHEGVRRNLELARRLLQAG